MANMRRSTISNLDKASEEPHQSLTSNGAKIQRKGKRRKHAPCFFYDFEKKTAISYKFLTQTGQVTGIFGFFYYFCPQVIKILKPNPSTQQHGKNQRFDKRSVYTI